MYVSRTRVKLRMCTRRRPRLPRVQNSKQKKFAAFEFSSGRSDESTEVGNEEIQFLTTTETVAAATPLSRVPQSKVSLYSSVLERKNRATVLHIRKFRKSSS